MAEASTIFEAATACHHILRTAITVPRLMQQEWAENRLADFNLWAMGAGASSTGKASLDHRLRANPEAHTILLNLLLMLQILLQKCIDGCLEIEETVAELSGQESAKMKDVEDSLNQLTRLTVAIRKAGTRSRLQKADSLFDPDGPQIRSLRRHLEFLILVRPDEHGGSSFSENQLDSSRLSPIQLRLIHANLKRRNRFIYAQQHAQKLENNSGHPKNTPRGKFGLVKHSRHFDLAQTASLMDEENTLAKDDPQAQSTTTATVVDEKIEIPSAQVMRKHLMGDVLPYTCIVEDCPQADMFYTTKETWLSHMGEEHGDTVQWVCHACSQKNIYATFRDPADFTAHLEQQHSKGIKPSQIPMLLSSWRRKVPFEISVCPLCGFQSDDQTAVLDHTAEHVHSFSLRSLPWAPREGLEIDDDDEEEEYGEFFDEHPYFDVNSCWSEPSATSSGESHLATDPESIADSESGEPAHPMHEQEQQQQQLLTEDLISQMPHDSLGQIGTSDWLNSLTSFSSFAEHRLGLILANRLELTGVLAVEYQGAFYSAVDIQTQIQYMVKALSKTDQSLRVLKFQQREIRLHHRASQHPNVVSLVRIMDSTDCTYVVLEFLPEGDLFENIVDKGNYVGNDPLVKRVFIQILDAVQFCHSVGIYHRNLKAENIYVADGGMTVKIGDFSLATEDYSTSDFGCGSTFYMSPECQQANAPPNSSYLSAPNDVWSLGVILVNLTCGRNPWKRASLEDSTYRAYIKDPLFLQSILPLSTEGVFILSRIFERDPSTRITIPELRNLILECPRFTTNVMTPYVASSVLDPPWQGPDDFEGPSWYDDFEEGGQDNDFEEEYQYNSVPETVGESQQSDPDDTSITSPFLQDVEWMYESSGGQ
ncbi:uncharacterized protein N7496_003990 [Penicillium cataractarum]|uniref:Protein kinase domain-containing protein n=1 Tax=Penicillium cataractarum TaxID=2100454 RepID=A0A9W9SN65_9EURO|nr:uncharacterized protein N7496_003990 [Penicillium cataractarum]KAJ5381562.1 hypothetical protein N7496_003990 [Penicillium cataractarum]